MHPMGTSVDTTGSLALRRPFRTVTDHGMGPRQVTFRTSWSLHVGCPKNVTQTWARLRPLAEGSSWRWTQLGAISSHRARAQWVGSEHLGPEGRPSGSRQLPLQKAAVVLEGLPWPGFCLCQEPTMAFRDDMAVRPTILL